MGVDENWKGVDESVSQGCRSREMDNGRSKDFSDRLLSSGLLFLIPAAFIPPLRAWRIDRCLEGPFCFVSGFETGEVSAA